MNESAGRDKYWMVRALDLAARGRGFVSPNPLVGCIIVDSDGRKIGEGWHERFGKEHAEINALKSVKDISRLKNATVYVTLEPCAHHGKTPPCAIELAKWPLKRIVIALQDPNPKVNGGGISILKKAGFEVVTGVLEEEARKLNTFFLHHISTGRPFVTLKIAQTLDGYIATPGGSNEVVTGVAAQKRVHYWRSEYDAVLIGRNTAELDNPKLTVRLVEGRQPFRIVLDGPGSLPEDLHLFADKFAERTFRVTWNRVRAIKPDPMLELISGKSTGFQWLATEQKNGHVDLDELFEQLGSKGIASVLVEGGQKLSSALLQQNLVDRLEVFIAPKILGGGVKSVSGMQPASMEDAISLRNATVEQVGTDWLFTSTL